MSFRGVGLDLRSIFELRDIHEIVYLLVKQVVHLS